MAYTTGRPRLFYERRGTGEPLLLVTGFTISAAVFDPIVPFYADRFECVAYDHRGSGRSETPLHPTSMPELAADAVRVLDAAGLDSAHVYGVSMGGMVAQELAIRFPEKVRGLILGGTTPGGPQAIRPTVKELATLTAGLMGAAREEGRPWLSPALFTDDFRRRHPERVRELLKGFRAHRAPPHGTLSHLLASVYHDTVSRLDQIQAPTLVMHGEHDAMAPLDNARLLADAIPRAELAVIPDAGHAYGLERPDYSRDVLLDWLDRQGEIEPGRARDGLAARAEPVTRALGLPIGALRTGVSLLDKTTNWRKRDVAVDRRAA